MVEITRRKALKAVAATSMVSAGVASQTQSVKASINLSCNAENHGVTGTDDPDVDGEAYVEKASNGHSYEVSAIADIENGNGCVEEITTSRLYQERNYCDQDGTTWEPLINVEISCKGEDCWEKLTSDGSVAKSGDGWVATGDYQLKVISQLQDVEDCYSWYSDVTTCAVFGHVEDNYDNCHDNIQ